MNWKIGWNSNCYDEIELVYEKAEANENAARLLAEFEEMALAEAEQYCGLLNVNDRPLTREMFLSMSSIDKEKVIYTLAGVGLEGFTASMSEPVITVTLSAHIQLVLGCTMFAILNRLEKLDGSYNVIRFPKATLEMMVPLGGRTGLIKYTLLILSLYPWLSVSEQSRNVVATAVPTANSTPPAPAEKPETKPAEKKGFFSKFFGK